MLPAPAGESSGYSYRSSWSPPRCQPSPSAIRRRSRSTTRPFTRPLKSFLYARANDPSTGDNKAGKLTLAKRFNWVNIVGPLDPESGTFSVVLSQAYRYQGRGGRVSQRRTRFNLGGNHYAFNTGFAYDELGNLSRLDYPRCLHYPCVGLDPPRTVDFAYTRGYLSSVPGFASSLRYQRGGMLHQVSHANAVVETVEVDPIHPFDRPYRITTSGVTPGGWDSGVYEYDGSGNVKRIGSELYRYDRMSRLIEGQVSVGGATKSQSLVYDAFGNIQSLATDGAVRTTPTSAATNRLIGALYDAGGNLVDVTLDGEQYVYRYDALNMMKSLQSTTDQARIFLYDADDERIMTFNCALVECQTQSYHQTTTIRGLDGKVLRVYNEDFNQPWDWVRDYVYRDGQLLASVQPDGAGEATSHFHLDHLGSPRQITDGNAIEVAFHTYYPFGEEATDPGQDGFQLKFTGHERDENGGQSGALDYMMARYFQSTTGRMTSIDPVLGSIENPQSWNRYTYSRNNPIRFIDPTGRESFQYFLDAEIDLYLEFGIEPYFHDQTMQNAALFGVTLASPVPGDEAGVAAMLLPKVAARAAGLLGRAKGFFGKLFRRADDVPQRATELGDEAAELTRPNATSAPTEKRARELGDRFKKGDDALRQLEEIESAQRRVRQGKSHQVIDSIEKSKQRAKHQLRRIKTLKDVEDDF